MSKFELGMKLRDKVTGFEGIATAKIVFLNGCVQYCLKPKLSEEEKKKGNFTEGQYIDIEQLEKIGDGITSDSKPRGGPENKGSAPDSYSGN